MLKNNVISLADFNSYKRLLNSAIKQAKLLYYIKKSFKFNGDIKRTWKFINEVLNKNERKPIYSINNSNSVELKGNEMVNYFNSYFINVITDLTNNYNYNINNADPQINVDHNQIFFSTNQSK